MRRRRVVSAAAAWGWLLEQCRRRLTRQPAWLERWLTDLGEAEEETAGAAAEEIWVDGLLFRLPMNGLSEKRTKERDHD